MLDQMFQQSLDRRILSLVIRASPWGGSQLHGISGWAARAGACPGAGATPRKPNFQTSGYGTDRDRLNLLIGAQKWL
jgi:hypothetical protein